MSTLEMVLAIVTIILAIAVTVVVLLQKSREADASAVQGGSSNQFFDKTAGHQKDDMLANLTKILGGLFFLVALATVLVTLFVK